MSAPIVITETSKLQRFGGAMLVIISLPLTLLWLWLGFPPRFDFGDLIFLLGGPGMLAFGIWTAFRQMPSRTRLTISPDQLVIYPAREAAAPMIINLDDLTSVTQTGLSHNNTRLRFAATTGDTEIATALLDREPAEILRLITVQLENKGRHLSQTSSPVLGAPTGVWAVRDGIPFKTN